MRLKSVPQKLNFVIAKAISKSYTLDLDANAFARSCIATRSNAASFLIKNILCETNNIYFSKNY